ncbi:MAG: diguanylate cyclase, partial [Methylococcaceae bacterium]|nr:diguanylate cyclase [Methylococcaceae bacterium]
LNVKPKQRSLEATYTNPESLNDKILQKFAIKIDALPMTILNSLRERQAIIINASDNNNKKILELFRVEEFLIVPVLSQNRLIALLYVDNHNNKRLITLDDISQITPIIHELGVALTNAKRFELEKKRAEVDALTELPNKRMVTEYLTSTFQLDLDLLKQVAVGFIDIDLFKKFNDTCGHQAGDDVLKIVAEIMRTLTRPSDFIGRYGGEEFVFVLHDSNEKGAYKYAERVRLEIERKGKILSHRFQGHALTVSMGVSLFDETFSSYKQMIEVADAAMYTAKQKGRNRVVIG